MLTNVKIPPKETITYNKTQGETVSVPCAKCSVPTRHDVAFSVDYSWRTVPDDIQGYEYHQIVRCRGCDSRSFRVISSNSEDIYQEADGSIGYFENVQVYPPRAAGRPELRDTHFLPYEVRHIYEETYTALSSELSILAAIGIRTLVEAVCVEKHAHGRNMYTKINHLVGSGVLTQDGADILHQVRSMGNDAAHEVKRHDLETLGTAFDVAENLLQNVYILPEKAARLAK